MRTNLAVLAASGLASAALAIPPVDNEFDWVGHQRTFELILHPTAVGHAVGGAGGTNIADAFKSGAGIWNAAGTGWDFRWAGDGRGAIPAGLPVLTVRMGRLFDAGGGLPAGPDDFVPPSSGQGANIDDHGGGGGGGGPSNALAIFRTLGTAHNGLFKRGEIVVSPLDVFNPWGLSNLPGPIGTFDPIITSMHEFGHALRLDHNDLPDMFGGLNDTIQIGREVGPVMRSKMNSAVHQVNPVVGTPRRLWADAVNGDIAGATWTAANVAPTPGSVLLIGLGGLCAARRRR